MFFPKYDPSYDPLESLDQMKVRLVRHSLNRNNAVWVPERRMVIVDRGLRSELFRPTVAHEVEHAAHDDPGGHHPRNEARADLHSAIRLINPQEWENLISLYPDYDHICLELGITRRQFRAYAEQHRGSGYVTGARRLSSCLSAGKCLERARA